MPHPRRIQRTRIKGQKLPVRTVYVGRPSKWGNPFVGPHAAKLYQLWLMTGEEFPQALAEEYQACNLQRRRADILAALLAGELAGRPVACWCGVSHACHGDVLLGIDERIQGVGQ